MAWSLARRVGASTLFPLALYAGVQLFSKGQSSLKGRRMLEMQMQKDKIELNTEASWTENQLRISPAGMVKLSSDASEQEEQQIDANVSANTCFDLNLNYWGNDIRVVPGLSSSAQCQEKCVEEPGCEAWTMGSAAVGGGCFLKTMKGTDLRYYPGCISGPRECKITSMSMCLSAVFTNTCVPPNCPHGSRTVKAYKGSKYSTQWGQQKSFSVNAQVKAKYEEGPSSVAVKVSTAFSSAMQSAVQTSDFSWELDTLYVNLDKPCYVYKGEVTSSFNDGTSAVLAAPMKIFYKEQFNGCKSWP